ncbi:hypothetical protein [Aneurinibacillus thermoaerophilus]|uniref:Uncharacterized protein n=1 Tax=Aneurinibacillus thermoaerophilus TaxID=143495 RepID=A0ABX8YG88_ANETH|nr:hypothetical protein [Aneurinibacillus thermoaerophilus]MED0676033.1 hypothetical protein [Aneurinibacillus thermoaerophilus]MED0681090.1 hypothetical protein [Aneurinibacillus thermoaerophilus]MED0736316.1 hypothetical protein [Aneurinibacillus thermoaerophilus]MED0758030.1 hypothetical protein [Aneurinibacillus thermoaerophilus]MED0759499.1 hypothetical protein [Aneurinibacillus thermoaerophilus]
MRRFTVGNVNRTKIISATSGGASMPATRKSGWTSGSAKPMPDKRGKWQPD